jgi:inosine-uridine nucleoside N-ribohydrolase
VPDAVDVLREALASAEDGSVTIIQVGFSTNLARLLDSAPDDRSPLPGRELVRQKVRLLSIMGGQFPDGDPEYNIRMDIPSARKLVDEWPTKMVFSGYEIGLSIPYPAASIQSHFAYVDDHPIADAYHHYLEMPYDRPSWDLTSVLYAVRPDEGYFDLSEAGHVTVLDDGHVRHEASAGGMHQYLIVDDEQRARVKEALIYLASQPPDARRRD